MLGHRRAPGRGHKGRRGRNVEGRGMVAAGPGGVDHIDAAGIDQRGMFAQRPRRTEQFRHGFALDPERGQKCADLDRGDILRQNRLQRRAHFPGGKIAPGQQFVETGRQHGRHCSRLKSAARFRKFCS
ncbi:hypothetical protein SDC9_87118 [bioreactor metagenome]|uniref:Uncharacterized protein n=1 Tax=bioreactor metagenome TaxID=1076179 RepID=A0A644ZS96_9ZZZZ